VERREEERRREEKSGKEARVSHSQILMAMIILALERHIPVLMASTLNPIHCNGKVAHLLPT